MNISATMNIKARRKGTPNPAQGWLPLSNNNQFKKITFDSYHAHLISIAKAFHVANEEFLAIVEEYLRWRAWSNARYAFGFKSQKPGRFTDDDLSVLKDLVQAGPPEGKFGVPQLLERLRQTSYIDIWRRAIENMAYLKNHPKHYTKKHQTSGRKRAERIKECRVIVETSYGKVENELRNQMLFGVCDGILEKMAMLRKYEDAYPVSSSDSSPGTRFQFSVSTLLGGTSVWMFLSLIPMGIAWMKSTSTSGSTGDSDFWTLIQSSMMQILGLALAVCNIPRKSTERSTAWTCALILTCFGIVCALASIPTYLYLSTMWSNLLSYGATIAQTIVMLELTLMTDHSKIKQT
ncbi:uncharacterized protein GGS22DRAFT_56952 [Annulohypoxylon maeteangense]|uniref:uncharacterized protein n=1 Tax=Annulohypoxylon maeteangense TaxID=1927788 RepID=UPI0020079495|nr:uncharacterized protein GGS22DRAFT_56952 [Annulohypoxylon maeteangense]KAI0881816.1 hypothetical protein GGS22DRAFT_56952 [Annulohypoxylon maeteangense]